MSLSIASNTESLLAARNLNRTQKGLSQSISRLSSGLRINSAADDAAGLAISEKMRSQVRSYGAALRNAMDGISMIQIAEGTLNEVAGLYGRMRELAVQGSTGTISSTDRAAINDEYTALQAEADRLAENTDFNGINLIGTGAATIDIQVGINSGANYQISVTMVDVTSITPSGNVSSAASSLSAIGLVDTAISALSSGRAKLGASQNRLQASAGMLENARANMSAAESRIRDANVAEESAALARHSILAQAGAAALGQANQLPALALALLGG